MGLAGVKKRSKLSQDPNNTTWAKSTSNFGHKILSKQGWKPGDYLGAENASHSEHYTAANASHIRVMLREDNLGLGAQIGKGNAETFGLSMFSGLLGRLNGKSDDDVQKQQSALRDAELRSYTGQKYGFMNFVSGGLLVGDKIKPKTIKAATKEEGQQSSRKRKASELLDESAEETGSKKSKKSEANEAKSAKDASKKGKKQRKSKGAAAEEQGAKDESSKEVPSDDDSESDDNDNEKARKKERRKSEKQAKRSKSSADADEKSRLKAEKRARKEERRKRKEEKRRKREATKKADTTDAVQTSAAASESEGTATPPVQQAFSGRQAVRQRYIQQKRMASMDPQALKEIFMLQAKAAA